jgi:two-component system sensor histidine kinase/response regulator
VLEGLNILIAEDMVLNQKVLNFILHRQGAKVTNVLNGKEAINLLKQYKYDIVLMDIQMPEMDGLTAIRYIRQDLKDNTPVIGITAGINPDENQECLDLGMNACVSKPVEPAALCNLILESIQNA